MPGMIQFLRQQCCCGGPCPCAVSDDFAVDSIADYDVTGTFAVSGGVLTASTAGTATQTLKLPSPGSTRAAGVSADVTNNSHTLFGLVIGSGDNRIEWLWDVANTQCTLVVYSEGVAIVDVDYAGAPATSLEVQIVPNDCSWDITVYRDGTLVATHTDIAVTFDADWTAFGVTASDASGGTWDNLCLRSCVTTCTTGCGDLILPLAWKLTASGFAANGSWAGDTYGTGTTPWAFIGNNFPCEDGNSCGLLNGEWFLLNAPQAGAWHYNIAPDQPAFSTINGWRDFTPTAHFDGTSNTQSPPHVTWGCVFLSVYDEAVIAALTATVCDSSPHGSLAAHVSPIAVGDPQGTWGVGSVYPTKMGVASAIKGVRCHCDDNTGVPATYKSVVSGNFAGNASPGYHAAWMIVASKIEVSGSHYFRFIAVAHPLYADTQASDNIAHPQGWAVYYADVPTTATNNDATGVGPVTLNLVTSGNLDSGSGTIVPSSLTDGSSNRVCSEPSTITIEPISSLEIAQQDKLSGSDGCEAAQPCETLYSEHGVLKLQGTLGGQAVDICLSGPIGYSNGPWTSGAIGPVDHGMTGDCASTTFEFTVECQRVCEGRYQWALTITDGTDTAVLPFDPTAPLLNGDDLISGTVDLCGTTGLAFAALLTDFTGLAPEDHPAVDCCVLDVSDQCGLPSSIAVRVEVTYDGGDPLCECSSATGGTLSLVTGDIACGASPVSPVPTGFSSAKHYFQGTIPYPCAPFGDVTIIVYCDGTNMRYALLQESGGVCSISAQGTLSLNCALMQGSFPAFFPNECATTTSVTIHLNQ